MYSMLLFQGYNQNKVHKNLLTLAKNRNNNKMSTRKDDFVPQLFIFSLEQWKYPFLTQKFTQKSIFNA